AFMYVDRYGRVRSPVRYRAMQALGYTCVAGTVALPVVYGILLGPIGAALGLGLSGFIGIRIRTSLRVQRAAVLLAHGRADEAAALLESALRARFIARES